MNEVKGMSEFNGIEEGFHGIEEDWGLQDGYLEVLPDWDI